MPRHVRRLILGIACGVLFAAAAHASSPAERVVCTETPRAQWLPEARIRQIFGAADYSLARLKVSRGNCYEFYAIARDGGIVEAYYHPVSGQLVRHNRVGAGSPR